MFPNQNRKLLNPQNAQVGISLGMQRPKHAESTHIHLCGRPDKPTFYSILPQSRQDLGDPENSPSISMWPYLLASAQTQRLNDISIYVANGSSFEEVRYLYFNDFGLTIWREMDRATRILGRLYRPPRDAVLSFGMPFSE